MDIIGTLEKYVWGFPEDLPWLVVVLLAAGLYVTLRLVFVQLRQVGHAIKVVTGRYDDPNDPGDVNHFQALSTALSATVGIGNIAGVATAIHMGGPGAIFWMWVTAIFGMALKFTECTLSLHYRSFDEKGEAAGGPMYYIERGLGKAWKPLAIIFAFCAVLSSFGSGNMNQANTVASSAHEQLGLSTYLVGGVLVLIVGAVILGGIKSIARVSSKLAPTMAVIYVLASLVIIAMHADQVPAAFATIFESAFAPEPVAGGSVAGVFSLTLLWGVKRGLFSNEAGQGSAPIAHAAAKTEEPVREGAVAMLGPLIDTLIICTMTALVIVITGVWKDKKFDTKPLSKVSAALVADAPEAGAATVTIPVTEGEQEGLVFTSVDAPVDDPVLMTSDGEPFDGTLVYTVATGVVAARTADGQEVSNLEVHALMLRNGSPLTSWAFEEGLSSLGDWGDWVVTLCVFLFAISTMISWSYYGDRCVAYLFGARYVIAYRVVFLGFVFMGSVLALKTVWTMGDIALGLMTVPNLIAVALLTPKVVDLSRDYFKRMKEARYQG